MNTRISPASTHDSICLAVLAILTEIRILITAPTNSDCAGTGGNRLDTGLYSSHDAGVEGMVLFHAHLQTYRPLQLLDSTWWGGIKESTA
ncbi:hypothetical protein F5B22DRAFT_527287 [Xylaria bambusicola]|uniref:uncharacterized protein n=1 Tax=Xylaria bambusicola TaxID=326684 RepID=UPI002007283F|nr:uncharacterized protein F5B22DRAFT_527287 [Xylaria bambusicola]KAI0505395.1 hypothetical protein F5B22DRAFT_527287 [Xylaria bambusicola]